MFAQQGSKIGDSSFSLSMFPLGGLQKNRIYMFFGFFFKKKVAETGICLLVLSRKLHQNVISVISKFMIYAI